MSIKATLSLLLGIVIISSCKKSGSGDDTPKEPTATKKVLVKITEVRTDQIAGTAQFTNFTYDNQGRLLSRKTATQEINYTYNSGHLFQQVSTTVQHKAVRDFTYRSGQLTSISGKGGITMDIPFEIRFIYQDEKIVQVERVEDKLLTALYKYQYTGNNVASSETDDFKYIYKNEYTYDDKRNVNYGLGLEMLTALALVGTETPTENNLKTHKYSLYEGGKLLQTSTSTYEYTYDNDGYPLTCVRKSQHSSQPNATETKFSYEYKIIE